jgi:hypothetical protein
VGKKKLLILLTLLAGVRPGETLADPERPAIVDAQIYVAEGRLMSDITAENLFSDRIVGTVQSGLPAVVELLFKLTRGKNTMVNQGLIAYELHYDVWDDRYMITDVERTRIFPTFDDMSAAIHSLNRISIGLVRMLEPQNEYTVEFGLAVHPLRSKDKQEIQGWVSENVRGSQGGQREQILNLNELIERFFARNKDNVTRSEWFRTRRFRLDDVPVREVE